MFPCCRCGFLELCYLVCLKRACILSQSKVNAPLLHFCFLFPRYFLWVLFTLIQSRTIFFFSIKVKNPKPLLFQAPYWECCTGLHCWFFNTANTRMLGSSLHGWGIHPGLLGPSCLQSSAECHPFFMEPSGVWALLGQNCDGWGMWVPTPRYSLRLLQGCQKWAHPKRAAAAGCTGMMSDMCTQIRIPGLLGARTANLAFRNGGFFYLGEGKKHRNWIPSPWDIVFHCSSGKLW